MRAIGQSASASVVVHRVLYFEDAHGLVDIGSEGPPICQSGQGLIDNGRHALAVRQILTELYTLGSVDFDERLALFAVLLEHHGAGADEAEEVVAATHP